MTIRNISQDKSRRLAAQHRIGIISDTHVPHASGHIFSSSCHVFPQFVLFFSSVCPFFPLDKELSH